MSAMSVVHIQTTTQTIFGILDADGDVVDKRTVNAAVRKLSAQDFRQLLEALLDARGRLKDEIGEAEAN